MDNNFRLISQQLAEISAKLDFLGRQEEKGRREELARDGVEESKIVQLGAILSMVNSAAASLQEAANSNFWVELFSALKSPLVALLLVNMAHSTRGWGKFLAFGFALCADPLSVSLYYGVWTAVTAWRRTNALWQRICAVFGGGGRNSDLHHEGRQGDAREQPESFLQRLRGMLPSWPVVRLPRVTPVNGVGDDLESGRGVGVDNATPEGGRGRSRSRSFRSCRE
jgi:hypothetical protein